jgi:hypothetical protein
VDRSTGVGSVSAGLGSQKIWATSSGLATRGPGREASTPEEARPLDAHAPDGRIEVGRSEPDFLRELAQCRRSQRPVVGIDVAPGEGYMTRGEIVLPHGPLNQEDFHVL